MPGIREMHPDLMGPTGLNPDLEKGERPSRLEDAIGGPGLLASVRAGGEVGRDQKPLQFCLRAIASGSVCATLALLNDTFGASLSVEWRPSTVCWKP